MRNEDDFLLVLEAQEPDCRNYSPVESPQRRNSPVGVAGEPRAREGQNHEVVVDDEEGDVMAGAELLADAARRLEKQQEKLEDIRLHRHQAARLLRRVRVQQTCEHAPLAERTCKEKFKRHLQCYVEATGVLVKRPRPQLRVHFFVLCRKNEGKSVFVQAIRRA